MNSSDGAMPELPADIITDILSRLPVQTLCQFRCVSKSLLSLISNPTFIKQHLDRNNKNKQQSERLFVIPDSLLSDMFNCYSLVLESPNLPSSPVVFGSEQNRPHFKKIWGSCDGLLLLSDECSSLFVVNPSTRESRELPDSPFSINSATACYKYGFGFDSSCSDYKVVRISYEWFGSVRNSVSVYGLRADSWRRINSCPYEITRYPNPQGVLLNGAIHWLCDSGIVSFNLAKDKFLCFSFPNNGRQKFGLYSFGVIRGCLSGADYSNSDYDHVDVWVMEDYGVRDSWKRFTIDCSPSVIERTILLKSGTVLLIDGTSTILYDPKREKYDRLEVECFQGDVEAIGYEESLLQLP